MSTKPKIRWPEPVEATRTERVLAGIDDLACDSEVTTDLVGLAAGVGGRRVKAILAAQGTSFRAEVLDRRMARARELLTETNFAIRNVSRLCGYRDPSTFARRFAACHHGLSPKGYRVGHGGSARTGGATGAFRKAAARARAAQEGTPGPDMRRWRSLPGTMDVYWAERANEARRARLRGTDSGDSWTDPYQGLPGTEFDRLLDLYEEIDGEDLEEL